jgi:hypothetical protein
MFEKYSGLVSFIFIISDNVAISHTPHPSQYPFGPFAPRLNLLPNFEFFEMEFYPGKTNLEFRIFQDLSKSFKNLTVSWKTGKPDWKKESRQLCKMKGHDKYCRKQDSMITCIWSGNCNKRKNKCDCGLIEILGIGEREGKN